MKKPTLKEIRGNPVWLRVRKKYPRKTRENRKEEGRKDEIKEREEDENKTKQDQKGKTKSEEEEGIRKIEDAVEGVEEEIYHDAVEEERGTEESSKEEEKEENVESEIEAIQPTGVNPHRRNCTRTECNYKAIGPNCARNRVRTKASRVGCTKGQTVNWRGERDGQYGRHKHDQWMVKETVFNLLL